MSKENKKAVEFKGKSTTNDRGLVDRIVRATFESGTSVYSFGQAHALVVNATGDRYHIFQKVADPITNREIVIDVANFKFLEDAIASCKKIEQDVQREKLKSDLEGVEKEAQKTVAEIKSGQERMDFNE
jgi:hypothetical protein